MDALEQEGPSLADIVAKAWSSEFSLKVELEDTCFLVAIHAYLRHTDEATLDSARLREVIYPVVSEVSHGDSDSVSQRATRALGRLQAQRLLVRTDTAGVVSAGYYSLSQLGKAIAEWVVTRETLDSEDLQVMMTGIRAHLAEIKSAAGHGGDDKHWRLHVVKPLKSIVSGIMEMIDQRRRSLDVEHAEIRENISQMLDDEWFKAIDRCEELLGRTNQTLEELHAVLTQEVDAACEQLNEIEEAAYEAERTEVPSATAEVRRHLEQLNIWGRDRVHAWSEYYQRVHEFMRAVIEFDPDRAIRYRLRESIRRAGSPPWALMLSEQPSYVHMREVATEEVEIRVQRPAGDLSRPMETVAFEPRFFDRVKDRIDEKLKTQDQVNFTSLLQEFLPECGRKELYAAAGQVLERLVRGGHVARTFDWSWHHVGEGLLVQDLTVNRGGIETCETSEDT